MTDAERMRVNRAAEIAKREAKNLKRLEDISSTAIRYIV